MMLNLPPSSPIDRTCKGILKINLAVLGGMLGLGQGVAIEEYDLDNQRDVIRLLVVGAGMPVCQNGAAPEPVDLLLHATLDGDTQTIHASWAHAPEEKWLVCRRPLPVLSLLASGRAS